ncbi:hypothetical protein I4U23_020188 [Adineta vaga]|nr:hypothetical protein I4U23_020188 [Adineta vaga]
MLLLYFLLLHFNNIQLTSQVTYSCDFTVPCGCSASYASVSKIVGGENASENTWGWAVSLSIDDSWMCGGSLISSSWILTAAHCVFESQNAEIFVSAASNALYGAQQWRYASSVIVHPQYDENSLVNDIALIQVSSPFNMTDPRLSLICLPVATTSDYPPVGSTVVAIGWGQVSETGPTSKALQQVSLQRIRYESSSCRPIINNKTMQICAGVSGGNKDTCYGDSGGPLMFFTESRQWVIVGLTSYGYECASRTYAGIYTRMTFYLDWIRSMNVTDAVTANTITTTVSYNNSTLIGTLAMQETNSKNNSLSFYQEQYVNLNLSQITCQSCGFRQSIAKSNQIHSSASENQVRTGSEKVMDERDIRTPFSEVENFKSRRSRSSKRHLQTCQVCYDSKSSRHFDSIVGHNCRQSIRSICNTCVYQHLQQIFQEILTDDIRCPELNSSHTRYRAPLQAFNIANLSNVFVPDPLLTASHICQVANKNLTVRIRNLETDIRQLRRSYGEVDADNQDLRSQLEHLKIAYDDDS